MDAKYNIHENKAIVFLLLIFVFFAVSCNKNVAKKNGSKSIVVYPSPPEQAKFQFLKKITTSKDIGAEQNGFSKLVLGEEKAKGFVKPYGIALSKGKLYVCDNYGGGMEILDLAKKKFDFFSPTGFGKLSVPINCCVDDNGDLYVADMGRKEIVVFNAEGNFIKAFGAKDKFKPSDILIKGDSIFVSNLAGGKVNVYSKDSLNKLLFSFPKEEDYNAALGLPVNLAMHDNKIYTADFGYSQIKVFNTEGDLVDSIGKRGDAPGTFAKLKGIAVDKEGIVYAVDAAFENVQVFNPQGKLLIALGGHYNGPGGLLMPAKVIIDYDNLEYFKEYVDPAFDLKYLVIVTSQYGPDLINVYGRVEPKSSPKQ